MDPLEELVAREAIRDLLARYPMAFDERDWTAWESLWTEDLVWVVDGTSIEGLAAVREFMVGALPQDYIAKHGCGPSAVDLAADGQSARTYTDVVWIAANYENQIVARYVDDLVKCDGRWLIRRREEVPVRYVPGPPPMSEASLDLSAPTMRKDHSHG